MGLVRTFLVICCSCAYVTVSYQQQQRQYQHPIAFYYNDPHISSLVVTPQNPYLLPKNDGVVRHGYPVLEASFNFVSDDPELMWMTQSRTPSILSQNNKVESNKPLVSLPEGIEQRFFLFPNYFSNSSFNLLSFLRTSTTTTILTTITSTLTSATVKSCATATQFKATTASRRKRFIQVNIDDSITIIPSQVQSIQVSKPPGEVVDNRLRSEIEPFRKYRRNFEDRLPKAVNNRYIISTKSTTVTFTTNSMSTTTFTTSVTLGATTAISCLPSGITIC